MVAAVVLVGAWPSTEASRWTTSTTQGSSGSSRAPGIPGGSYDAQARARVLGCVVTRVPSRNPERPHARERLERALTSHDLHLLGAVPYERTLTQPRERDLVADLRPRVLSEGALGRRIREVDVVAQAVPGGLQVLVEGRG